MSRKVIQLVVVLSTSLLFIVLMLASTQIVSFTGRASASGVEVSPQADSLSAIQTLFTPTHFVYLPVVGADIPRPYVPPQDAVAVVNSDSYCHLWNTQLSTCWVTGEVLNTTSEPAYNVEVEQETCRDGEVIGSNSATTFLPKIAPGALSPFGISAATSSQDGTSLCGGPKVVSWSTQISATIEAVRVQTQTMHKTVDQFNMEIIHISGALYNDHAQALTSSVVAVTLYDGAGYSVDAGKYQVEETLAPGASATYTVKFDVWPWYHIYNGKTEHYAVQAQGVVTP
jgi:hypothetical protein